MSTMASQITGLTIVYSTVYSGADEKTSKLRVTGLCEGKSPVTGEFPALRTSNAKNVSIRWRQHAPGPFLPKGGVAWRGVYVCFSNDDFVMSIPFSNDDAVGAFDFQTMIPSVYLLFKGRCSLWWFSNGDSVCTLVFSIDGPSAHRHGKRLQ